MSTIPKPSGPDVDIGHQFLVTSWTLYSIATIVVALRLFAQLKVNMKLGWGDGLMVISLFFGILSGIMLTIAHHYGFGRHFFYLTASERVQSQMYTFINEPLGIAGSALGRLSFMTLMYRLFGTTKYRRWFILFLMGETIIINLVTAITIFTQCPDVRSLWDPVGHPGTCWSPLVQEYTGFFQGSCNAATDLTLTFLPAYIFWSLQMTMKMKLGLASLMCLSIFAFVASLVKVILLKSLGERSDYTFNTVPFFTWINVENTLVIIAASIPMIRPLFAHAPKNTSSYEMNNRYGSGQAGRKGYALSSKPHVSTGKFDNSSEEVILPVQGKGELGGIVKTIAFVVKDDEERDVGGDYGVAERGWSVSKK